MDLVWYNAIYMLKKNWQWRLGTRLVLHVYTKLVLLGVLVVTMYKYVISRYVLVNA